MVVLWVAVGAAGVAAIVWGADTFTDHLGAAAVGLRVSPFGLAVLLAGAEPEELATAVAAAWRETPAIAYGDVIGANVAMCLVALGVGALVAPLPSGGSVRRAGLAGLPAGALAAVLAWDGEVTRVEGAVLVLAYVAFVAGVWRLERRPPALGEVGALEEGGGGPVRPGRALVLTLGGAAAMAAGATALVEAVRRVTDVEAGQARIGLVVVGFATAFELVVLAWSAARRGATEAAVAAVVGSFTYNVTMTLGAAAVARPLALADASLLRAPWIAMLGALSVVLVLGRRGRLDRRAGVALLALYPPFVALALVAP